MSDQIRDQLIHMTDEMLASMGWTKYNDGSNRRPPSTKEELEEKDLIDQAEFAMVETQQQEDESKWAMFQAVQDDPEEAAGTEAVSAKEARAASRGTRQH